jgi:pyruvate/2-oxoglutarate dehydrogenase complex dihydrolipoamide acyltransferase (E2) component
MPDAATAFREMIAAFGAGERDRMRRVIADDLVAYVTNAGGGVDRVEGADAYLERVPDVSGVRYAIAVTQVVAVTTDQALGMVEITAERGGKTLHNFAAFGHRRRRRMSRPRGVDVHPFPSNRRLVTAALRAGKHMVPMHGLLDLDVTEATKLLAAHDPPLSFTAFVLASAGRAVAAHPAVHAYKNWRGHLVVHRHVDVSTIVEVDTAQGPFPLVHTVRDADVRTVDDLSAELRRVKEKPFPGDSGASSRFVAFVIRVPGAIRAMYAILSRSVRLRQRSGTVAVTAVGMFADGGGFAIAPLALMSLQIVVGGIADRPRVVGTGIEGRKVLDLTVSIDHNVVDGGPAARFGAELRHQIESAATMHPTT